MNISRIGEMADRVDEFQEEVRIAMVGKIHWTLRFISQRDQSFATFIHRRKSELVIDWIESTDLDSSIKHTDGDAHRKAWETLKLADGILVQADLGTGELRVKLRLRVRKGVEGSLSGNMPWTSDSNY